MSGKAESVLQFLLRLNGAMVVFDGFCAVD